MNTHAHPVHHHHAHEAATGRALILGILLNGGFVLAEIIYGIKAHSLALLADASHNAGDVLGLVMIAVATALSHRPASERFTYGLQSLSILAALANALVLMFAIGGIAWEAAQRLNTPESPASGTIIAVATLGTLINAVTAWVLHRDHHDLNMRGAFLHMATDAAISLGVVLSGALILATGWNWIDPLISLIIVSVIIVSSWRLLAQSMALAMHAVPDHIDSARVKAFLAHLEGVKEIHDLHIWAMSTTEIALSAHLVMPAGHPGDHFLHDLTHALEDQFGICHATLQIEMGNQGSDCHSGCH